MAEFVTVGRPEDVPEGEMRLFEPGTQKVAVANVDGTFYAFGDVCTHQQCRLHSGQLEGATVTCPCHGSQFDVRTGEVVNPPAEEVEPSFEVIADAGELKIRV